MKVVFHEDFYQVYTSDPAAATGRLEPVMKVIKPHVDFIQAQAATEAQLAFVHEKTHIEHVKQIDLFDIAALAAGAAIQAATIGLAEPCFGLIRPPGHHASSGSCWGFCYFNNMAVALEVLQRSGAIQSAYVLDIDLHYGDGTMNILGDRQSMGWQGDKIKWLIVSSLLPVVITRVNVEIIRKGSRLPQGIEILLRSSCIQ